MSARSTSTGALRRRQRIAIAAAVIGGCLAVAGCGSSNNTGSSSHKTAKSAASANGFIAFAQCMRANGVPNLPDPSGGGGIQIGSSSGVNPASPAFQAAMSKCTHLLPGGGPSRRAPSGAAAASVHRQMLDTSECMRAHGVTGFPDPTETAPPSPGAMQQNYSIAMGRDGYFLLVPKSIDVNSPAFEKAAAVCNFGPGGHGAKSVAVP